MRDDEFSGLLDDFLEPPGDPNSRMTDVEFVWIEDNPGHGALHMRKKHGVSKREVEEVILEVPPEVEAKRHPEEPGRTVFRGTTRHRRVLIISCEDWTEGSVRFLKPI